MGVRAILRDHPNRSNNIVFGRITDGGIILEQQYRLATAVLSTGVRQPSCAVAK